MHRPTPIAVAGLARRERTKRRRTNHRPWLTGLAPSAGKSQWNEEASRVVAAFHWSTARIFGRLRHTVHPVVHSRPNGAHEATRPTGPKKIARFDRPGRDPWKDKLGYRGLHEVEKPHGQWNRLEILCDGDRVKVTVNGHTTLDGTNAFPTSGKIVVQSEGAEIFFRRLDLYPLR